MIALPQRLTEMTRFILAPRSRSVLTPYVLHADDAVGAGAYFTLVILSGVDDSDDGGRHLTLAGMPEADPWAPTVEVEDLVAVHVLSPVLCGRLGCGGVGVVPAVFNAMPWPGVVHSFE
ncbi:MAG: hypothetical protein HOZ81_04825 [Streptomyces sp.]|nr:hypothetical protein [Streptomyces sp.]